MNRAHEEPVVVLGKDAVNLLLWVTFNTAYRKTLNVNLILCLEDFTEKVLYIQLHTCSIN